MLKKEVGSCASNQNGNTSPLLPRKEKHNHTNLLPVKYKPQAGSVNGIQGYRKKENRELVEKDEDDTPTDGYRWFIVLGCALVHVIIGGFGRSDGVLYLKLINKFHGSAQATAWVFSLCSTVLLLLAPLASVVTNKFSARISVFTGGIIAALGVFMSAFAPSLPFLYVTYGLITGIGGSLAHTPGLVTVGQYFKKKRGLAVGLSTAGTGVGTFVFPPLFEYIFQEFNYFGAFLILSAIPLHLCVAGALYRPLRLHSRIVQIQRESTEKDSGEYIRQKKEESCFLKQDEVIQLTQTGLVENVNSGVSKQNKDLQAQCRVFEDKVEAVSVQKEAMKAETEAIMCAHYANKIVCEAESRLPEVITQDTSSELCSYIEGKKEAICWQLCMKCLKRKHHKQDDESNKNKKSKLLDVNLLKQPTFALFSISLCLFSACFRAGFTFLPAMAKSGGCSETQAALLLSVAGISDTICRVGSGIVLDLKKVRRFRPVIYNGIPFVISLVLFLCPTMSSFLGFAIIAALFGCLTGSFASQKTVILIDILGKDKLPSSLGLLTCIQGFGLLIGPPLSGALKDVYGHYQESFYFSGVGVLLAGLIMIVSNVIRVVQQRRSKEESDEERSF